MTVGQGVMKFLGDHAEAVMSLFVAFDNFFKIPFD